jgi:hypothetical protein
MRNVIQLKKFVFAWLIVLWSVAAWAAESTFAKDMASIPLEAIQLTVFLAFIGGLAFTTNKISRPDVIVKNVWLEMAKDILMSLVAGLITFFFTSWVGSPYWLQAGLITISGYGGSKALDKYLNDALFAWIDKAKPAPTGDKAP